MVIVGFTWNVKYSCPGGFMPALSPNHLNVAFTNPRMETNAIRLTATLATSLIELDAPRDAASITFLSVLNIDSNNYLFFLSK